MRISFLRCAVGAFAGIGVHVVAIHAQVPPTGQQAPLRSRELPASERATLAQTIPQRFQQAIPRRAQFRAAGPFRFVTTGNYQYMDRTDVGSVAFERTPYGLGDQRFDSVAIGREALLQRVDAALAKARVSAPDRKFVAFQDEFVGTTRPTGKSIEIDPRSVSRHVARTAEFARVVDGLPVFGSELIVGLMPDGSIGRLRMHWPDLSGDVVKGAHNLASALSAKQWTLPESMRTQDTEILEVTAGVGHSAFADPVFLARPVVRVLYRRSSGDPPYRLSTTGYKYFDGSGGEIVFSSFPQLPATPEERKPVPATKKP